jgi:endonuclease YncB( thermonuclease family)
VLKDNYVRNATVLEVHDGDTILCRIDCGYNLNGPEVWLRIRNDWAAELDEPKGPEAGDHLREILARANNQVVVQTFPIDEPKKIVTGRGVTMKQSFVRYIADVYIMGRSVAEVMVADGFATAERTDGKSKK